MSCLLEAVGPGAEAATVFLGPFLAGLALGVVARRLGGARARSGMVLAAILVGPVGVACLLPESSIPLGFWDRILVAVLLGLGGAAGARGAVPRFLSRDGALLAASSLVSIVLLELAVRAFLPAPPSFPPAHLFPGPAGAPDDDRVAAVLFPAGPSWADRDTPLDPADAAVALAVLLEAGLPGPTVPPTLPVSATLHWLVSRPLDGRTTLRGIFREAGSTSKLEEDVAMASVAPHRVLHVGDSMLTASQGGPTFIRLADAAPGPIAHVDAAVGGVGPDVYYQAVRQWLPRLRPDLVMVWVYEGNDLLEVDRPYALCNDGPLLDYATTPPGFRCLHAVWGASATSPRLASPAPFPLRAATRYSFLARHLCALFHRPWDGSTGGDRELAVHEDHLERILAALRDLVGSAGARMILAVLPATGQVLGNAPPQQLDVHRRMLRVLSGFGEPWLDPLAVLQEAAARLGPDGLYQADGVHFTAAGHRVVAAWLQASLPAIGYPSADAPAQAPAD